MSLGWIYILSNPSMPNLIKIGKTTRQVQTRVKELNRATGVPTPFKIEYAFYVTDCHAVENAVHRALRHARTNSRREFFTVTPEDAKIVVERLSDTTATDLSISGSSGCLGIRGCLGIIGTITAFFSSFVLGAAIFFGLVVPATLLLISIVFFAVLFLFNLLMNGF